MNDSLSKQPFLKLALQNSLKKLCCLMPFYSILINSRWMNGRLINCQLILININIAFLLIIVGIIKNCFNTLTASLAQKKFFLNIFLGRKSHFNFWLMG